MTTAGVASRLANKLASTGEARFVVAWLTRSGIEHQDEVALAPEGSQRQRQLKDLLESRSDDPVLEFRLSSGEVIFFRGPDGVDRFASDAVAARREVRKALLRSRLGLLEEIASLRREMEGHPDSVDWFEIYQLEERLQGLPSPRIEEERALDSRIREALDSLSEVLEARISVRESERLRAIEEDRLRIVEQAEEIAAAPAANHASAVMEHLVEEWKRSQPSSAADPTLWRRLSAARSRVRDRRRAGVGHFPHYADRRGESGSGPGPGSQEKSSKATEHWRDLEVRVLNHDLGRVVAFNRPAQSASLPAEPLLVFEAQAAHFSINWATSTTVLTFIRPWAESLPDASALILQTEQQGPIQLTAGEAFDYLDLSGVAIHQIELLRLDLDDLSVAWQRMTLNDSVHNLVGIASSVTDREAIDGLFAASVASRQLPNSLPWSELAGLGVQFDRVEESSLRYVYRVAGIE